MRALARVPYLALTLGLAVFLLGFEVHGHGRTTDDGVQRRRGETMLAYLGSLDEAALPGWDLEDFSKGDKLYGPLGVTVAVAAGRVLGPLLGDPEEERWLPFHAGLTLWFLLLFWTTMRLGRHATGSVAGGALSGLALLAFPRVLGLATTNASDLPAAALAALALLALLAWDARRTAARALGLCAALGALAAVRPQNAALQVLVIGAVLVLLLRAERRGARAAGTAPRPLPWAWLALAPLVAYASWVLCWPDFWTEPLAGPWKVLQGYRANADRYVQGTQWFGEVTKPALYPLVYLAVTTPLPVLAMIGSALGLRPWRGDPRRTALVLGLCLWAAASVGKHLSGVANHGGIRHFLDAYVPLAILAALGALALATRLVAALPSRSAGVVSSRRLPWAWGLERARLAPGLALWATALFLPFAWLPHPWEGSYFNLLIGGPDGAVGRLDLEPHGTGYVQLLRRLRPLLAEDDFVLVAGTKDLALQLRLPTDPDGRRMLEVLPTTLPLFAEPAVQARLVQHRLWLLYSQDRAFGLADDLVADGVLAPRVAVGPEGLPVHLAFEVLRPAALWPRLGELFGR
ncbi:MAG: hypothetical protein R3F30_09965 [Planctomycetota bacterium]